MIDWNLHKDGIRFNLFFLPVVPVLDNIHVVCVKKLFLLIFISFSGGDSKTLMVVQISPVNKNISESQCSLSFAQRVRAVELGAASKKSEAAEVAVLKDRLAQYEVRNCVFFS